MTEDVSRLEDLKDLAGRLVQEFQYPQLVLLNGAVGSGKTQMVQFMLSALGVFEAPSPAFTLINTHQGIPGEISHIDLYRLKDREDLESTGFWDIFADSRLVFIEWASLLKEPLPPWRRLILSFELSSQGNRFLKWKWKWAD